MSDFKKLRALMVNRQLLPAQISDPTLIHAFSTVAREKCVPRQLARVAYMDDAIPLGKGQFLASPLSCAFFLKAAQVTPADKVLYIGNSGGYIPALLGKMGSLCVVLMENEEEASLMKELLEELFIFSAHVIVGSLNEGCPEMEPFDKILIEAQVDFIPDQLTEQLEKNGFLLCFRKDHTTSGSLVKYVRMGEEISPTLLSEMPSPVFRCFQREKGFVF